jgi:lipid II isoglutaminyl synthase (glutamine-hydrolysing)
VLEASGGKDLKLRGFGVLTTQLEGVHNHMNFAAAFALVSALKTDTPAGDVLTAMARIKPAFGRGETITAGRSAFDILLVKNPSSFVQTLKSTALGTYDTVTIMINDAYADSRDVSWLWDVEVAGFSKARKLLTAGTRGADMAVRLKYASVAHEADLGDARQAVRRLGSLHGRHAVFCTYTAMLALRKELVRLGHTEQVT